jgi:hypothetical protein
MVRVQHYEFPRNADEGRSDAQGSSPNLREGLRAPHHRVWTIAALGAVGTTPRSSPTLVRPHWCIQFWFNLPLTYTKYPCHDAEAGFAI